MRDHKIFRVWATAIAASALAGCAAAPPNVVAAGDAYRLRVSGARFESQADTNTKALAIASDHCAKMGKRLMFRQSSESGERSWEPKLEELTFICSEANDADFVHVSVQREPEIVAQQ